jgi:hypothetical protein
MDVTPGLYHPFGFPSRTAISSIISDDNSAPRGSIVTRIFAVLATFVRYILNPNACDSLDLAYSLSV